MLGNIWKAHDSSSWQNNFINEIQIHNQSPWFKPMEIYLSKAQFSLATSKTQLTLALFKAQFSLAILIGNIKAQFSLAISKAQFALALLKAQANYLALFYQKPKVIKYSAKYYIIIISLKSPIINNTLNS